MAFNPKYAVTLKNAQLDAITTAIGTSGLLRIYDGAQPASPDTAITSQNKLAELPLSSAFAGASSSGILTANTITTANAVATGTAAWFRLTTSGGTAKIDGTVGTAGCDLNLASTSLVNGSPVACSSFTVTAGN